VGRQRHGEVIVNPFSIEKTTVIGGLGNVELRNRWSDGSESFANLNGGGWGLGNNPYQAAIGRANAVRNTTGHDAKVASLTKVIATEARSRIAQAGNSAMVDLAEAREILALMQNPLKQGLNLAHAIEGRIQSFGRRGANSNRVREESAKLYLQYLFGVQPIVKSVEGLQDAYINTLLNLRKKRERATARDSVTSTLSGVADASYGGIGCNQVYDITIKTEVSCGFIFNNLNFDDPNREFGMRLTDIPRTAWAVMPYSFLIDWFTNVGTFISALTPIPGINHLGEWTTVHETTTGFVRADHTGSVSGWPNGVCVKGKEGQPAKISRVTITRVPNVPYPMPSFRQPTDKKPDLVGAEKAVTLLALWTAQHRKVLSLFMG